jgi:transposase-like protein
MSSPRRTFSHEFKRSILDRLNSQTLAELAREYSISPSVLHRWRNETGKKTTAISARRRRIPKEIKQAAVRRVDAGEPPAGVADALEVNPNMIHRWRQELHRFGGKAFSGYGRNRTVNPRTRELRFVVTPEEYAYLQSASEAALAPSLSAFVRAQTMPGPPEPSTSRIQGNLEEVEAILTGLTDALVNR